MKRITFAFFTLHFSLFTCLFASPVVQEITIFPFAATITQQADLVIEEYVPLDAKRPGKKWTFKNPNVSKRTVWSITAESNTVFNAWLDTDGNGRYDIGEPFGTSAGRSYPEIELSNISPITPRIDILSKKSETALTFQEIESNIVAEVFYHKDKESPEAFTNRLEKIKWINGNRIEEVGIESDPFMRIRVVRWLINGIPSYSAGSSMRTILEKNVQTGLRGSLLEAEFLDLDRKDFDIDWEYMHDEVASRPNVIRNCGEVTNMTYLIVVGDGPTDWRTFYSSNYVVRALGPCITRKFGAVRMIPNPLPPIVKGQLVTLVWRSSAQEMEGYTAYRAKIMSGATEIHDTGLFRNPARWADGSFHWTITNAIPSGTYNWKIAAYNSKYSNEQASAYTNGVPFTVTGE